MFKGWIAKLTSGKVFFEGEKNWKDISEDIIELYFDNSGQMISFPKKAKYFQSKSASASMTGSDVQIEARNIGFFVGNSIVVLKINEKTNNIDISIQEVNGNNFYNNNGNTKTSAN